MKLRNLGKSGLQVSVVGLGCNNFAGRIDLEASRAVVDKAIALGVTLFDTADSYGNKGGSETFLGKILGDRRKDIVLATKFGQQMDQDGKLKGASRRYIMTAVEASLRRLQTDWIDLYQVHFPDPNTPMEETLGALDDLVRSGKVRYIGCSNHPAWQVVEAEYLSQHHGWASFISCQDEYSLVKRDAERELIPAIQHLSVGLLPYFPLASGLLTGKYKRGAPLPEGTRFAAWQSPTFNMQARYMTEKNWDLVDRLQDFSSKRGHTLLELAFSWLLARPAVASVIAGATKPEQVEQNVNAAGWELTPDDLAEIDTFGGKP